MDGNILRDIKADRSTLEVKHHTNKIKEICVNMEDNEKGRQCLRDVNDFEANIENDLRPEPASHDFEQVNEPDPVEQLIH